MTVTEVTWDHVQVNHRDRLLEQGVSLEQAYACFPCKPAALPLPEVEAAAKRMAAATAERDAASAHRTEVMRAAYRDGATAARLSRLAGISLARVNVIVSGAR